MEVGGGISKEHEEIFMDEYDCVDSFISVYVCHINIKLNKLHSKYVLFIICQLCLNKAVLKNS